MIEQSSHYEEIVARIFDGLARLQGLDDLKVQRNVAVQGIGSAHDIDVLWDFTFAGIPTVQ